MSRKIRCAGFGEISQLVNRPPTTAFNICISETPNGGKWHFLGAIPIELVEIGTNRSRRFNSREEAVQAAKRIGYEEGETYSTEVKCQRL